VDAAGKIACPGAELKHSGRRVDARFSYHPCEDIGIRRSDWILFVPDVGIIAVRFVIVVENFGVSTWHITEGRKDREILEQEIAKIMKIQNGYLIRRSLAVGIGTSRNQARTTKPPLRPLVFAAIRDFGSPYRGKSPDMRLSSRAPSLVQGKIDRVYLRSRHCKDRKVGNHAVHAPSRFDGHS
jgi:hypothetical protein